MTTLKQQLEEANEEVARLRSSNDAWRKLASVWRNRAHDFEDQIVKAIAESTVSEPPDGE